MGGIFIWRNTRRKHDGEKRTSPTARHCSLLAEKEEKLRGTSTRESLGKVVGCSVVGALRGAGTWATKSGGTNEGIKDGPDVKDTCIVQ